jgi:GNAT superfamily N-acetyltransferase
MTDAVQIRPAREEDLLAIARVHVDSWRSSYASILPPAYLRAMRPEEKVALWRKGLRQEPGVVPPGGPLLVADLPHHGIVGFAKGGPAVRPVAGVTAELFVLYVLAAHHRHGFGSALFTAVLDGLEEEGHRSLMLWVPTRSPYRRYYAEALAGRPGPRWKQEIDGATFYLIAYLWKDLGVLRSLLTGRLGPRLTV